MAKLCDHKFKSLVDKYDVWSCEPHGENIPVSLKEYLDKQEVENEK